MNLMNFKRMFCWKNMKNAVKNMVALGFNIFKENSFFGFHDNICGY